MIEISGIIEFRNVSYSKNNNLILENISFSLKKNKYNVITGKNGSGKSTILKLIVGLEKIDDGEIFIDNEKLLYERDELYKIRKKTGIVFQESNEHIIGETVAESLIFGMENNRIPLEKMKENMSKYIKLFQLEDIIDKKTVNLSGGEKQKVALAGAVITEPDIILLDEITEMWDKITKDKMNGIIENFLRNGKTVVSVTHNSEEIRKSDNVIFITEERKIITGAFDEISQILQKDENKEMINRINKEKNEEIQKIYKNIKQNIDIAIKNYKKAWEGTEKEVFAEMAFCILTPQSKAKNAWQAITNLVENGLLYNGEPEEIVEFLNIVRFKNNKSRYLVEFRELMTRDGKLQPKKILSEIDDTFEKRKWILKNVKGMGLKEANHVLRNLGFGENIAILDRHILKNLKELNVIEEIPKSISEKKYYEIEEKMREYSKFSKIKMDELDLVLWYKQTGQIFK